MPTLEWIGKSKVVNHHLDVPYHILERKYSYDETGQHEKDNGSRNMIIHGDNLLALKSLLPEYEGQIKCIYIDPPYNTGSAFEHYDDNLEHSIWLGLMRERLKTVKVLVLFFIRLDLFGKVDCCS